MVTYSHVVMWLWVVALGATLLGLAVALRALGRVDDAVAHLRAATEAVRPVPGAAAALDRSTGDTAGQRAALASRAPS